MSRTKIAAVAGVAVLGIAAVGGAAWAMTGRPSGDVKPDIDRARCFNPTFMRGYQTPSDSQLIIETDSNQAYELTMAGPCFDLSSTFAIGIRSRAGMSEVCDPFDADIVFRDEGMGHHRECQVSAIRHLTGDEAAKYIEPVKHKDRSSSSRQ